MGFSFHRIVFLCISTPLGLLASPVTDEIDALMEEYEITAAIERSKALLKQESDPEIQAEIGLRLAIAYHFDQEQGRAIEVFLEALDDLKPPKTPATLFREEQPHYMAALEGYLTHQKRIATKHEAEEIVDQYAVIVKHHEEYAHLGYLVAAAHANLSDFKNFFPVFFAAYRQLPEHYLAYKTKAILHIRLWQRGRTPEEREKRRAAVAENIQRAIQLFPQDASLYRMSVSFASEDSKASVVSASLKNIATHNIMIARDDVAFFVREAVDTGQHAEAKALLTTAREWYRRSKALDAAEQYLREHRPPGNKARGA